MGECFVCLFHRVFVSRQYVHVSSNIFYYSVAFINITVTPELPREKKTSALLATCVIHMGRHIPRRVRFTRALLRPTSCACRLQRNTSCYCITTLTIIILLTLGLAMLVTSSLPPIVGFRTSFDANLLALVPAIFVSSFSKGNGISYFVEMTMCMFCNYLLLCLLACVYCVNGNVECST